MKRDLSLDWLSLLLYGLFVLFGWFNIYAASTNDSSLDLFNLDYNYGKQFVFILVCVAVNVLIINFINIRDIEFTSYLVYALCVLALLAVQVFGSDVKGARAWFSIGGFAFQPSEFAKVGTALALARFMSRPNFNIGSFSNRLGMLVLIGLPASLILLQNDTGTALVFGGLVLMLYREGLPGFYLLLISLTGLFGILTFVVPNPYLILNGQVMLALVAYLALARPKNWLLQALGIVSVYLLLFSLHNSADLGFTVFGLTVTNLHWVMLFWVLGLAAFLGVVVVLRHRQRLLFVLMLAGFTSLVFGVDFLFARLQPHQQQRIEALFNPDIDPRGINWNSTQSKIAIGSGGFWGKGYLNGTQTKFDFVPEQHTDFIFCTVGEEWGWLGTTVVLVLFLVLLVQMTHMAEECKSSFGRIYGYAVTSMFFMHIAINVAMTIGLAPVIGIPLPFFSYGGSSLLTFSVMLFILIRYYGERQNVLASRSL